MENVGEGSGHCSKLGVQDPAARPSKVCFRGFSRFPATYVSNAHIDFLKQNMKLAKAAMPKATHGEVMRALSERWKASGGAKSPGEIMQTGEDPLAVQRGHAEHWQVLSLQMQALSIA